MARHSTQLTVRASTTENANNQHRHVTLKVSTKTAVAIHMGYVFTRCLLQYDYSGAARWDTSWSGAS